MSERERNTMDPEQKQQTSRKVNRQRTVTTIALWAQCFVTVGVTKCLGIMLSTLREQFVSQTWIIGWIIAMIQVSSGISALFCGMFIRRFGTGVVFTVFGSLVGLSTIAASFTTTAAQLAMIMVPFGRSGFGIASVASKVAVGYAFEENFATAIGIGRSGFAFGLIALTPVMQLFLDTYGWRGALLLTGAISLHLIVCGVLMISVGQPKSKSKPTDYQVVQQDETSTSPTHPTHLCSKLAKNFDFNLFRNTHYWAVSIVYTSTNYVYFMWFIYFVSLVQSKGFSIHDGAVIVIVAGVGNLLGSIFQGVILDRKILSSLSLVTITTVVASATYYALPFITSYRMLMVSAFVAIFAQSALKCLADILIKELLGMELMAGAQGWCGLKGSVAFLVLGFLPGWIYDQTGSYDAACVMLGSVQASCLVSVLMVKLTKAKDNV